MENIIARQMSKLCYKAGIDLSGTPFDVSHSSKGAFEISGVSPSRIHVFIVYELSNTRILKSKIPSFSASFFNSSCLLYARIIISFCCSSVTTGSRAGADCPDFWILTASFVRSFFPE